MSELAEAAFGECPEADVSAAAAGGTERERWLAGVVLGGQGRYAAAASVLSSLLTPPVGDRVVAALAAGTVASHRRQLGDHAGARPLDAAALRLVAESPSEGGEPDPFGGDRAGARVDALLGLAADAIGLGRLSDARRLVRAAHGVPGVALRGRVRLGWVGAEVALAEGDAAGAVAPATRAWTLATKGAGQGVGVRHRVKSGLVLAAALTTGGTPDGLTRARELLEDVVAASLGRGMFPLAWPSLLILADLSPDRAAEHRLAAGNALTCVFDRSDGRMRQNATRSDWVPTALVRSGEPTRTGVCRTS